MSLFKVPKLRKKNSSWESTFKNTGQEDTCETFDFREISDLVEIGRGSFAAVFAAQYTTAKSSASKQVVVKKLFDLDVCEKGLFLKEVRLLHTLKHANIVSFHGMCTTPPSIMMEYMCFDFSPFEREQKVHSLKELLSELADGDPSDFIHVMPIIASDVTKGLRYLHDNGVVHRDLKPANVLVSNQHALLQSCRPYGGRKVLVNGTSDLQTVRFWRSSFAAYYDPQLKLNNNKGR